MTRKYHVNVIDTKGKPIITFKGTVVKKTQTSGRIAGPVRETLVARKSSVTIK